MKANSITNLNFFFAHAAGDARMSARHISLYTSLWNLWQEKGGPKLCVFSREVMGLCKISSASTYHRTIRELHAFGYIDYIPSFNRFKRSVVKFKIVNSDV